MPVMTDWIRASVTVIRKKARRLYDDGERDSKIVRQSPVATQFLLVAKMAQLLLVALLDR